MLHPHRIAVKLGRSVMPLPALSLWGEMSWPLPVPLPLPTQDSHRIDSHYSTPKQAHQRAALISIATHFMETTIPAAYLLPATARFWLRGC